MTYIATVQRARAAAAIRRSFDAPTHWGSHDATRTL